MADGSLPEFAGDSFKAGESGHSKTRMMLTRRLQDVVGLPGSRISPLERHIAADLLIEVLIESTQGARVRCAERMAYVIDMPAHLLRFLAKDTLQVATPLLEVCEAFNDSDLIATALASSATLEHRILIAKRKMVSEAVTDVLVSKDEIDVILALLHNEGARFAYPAIEHIVALSKADPRLISLLARRPELKPAHGLTMFWWAEAEERLRLLHRFAVERLTLHDAAEDIFVRAGPEDWQDPVLRKAFHFIERRQRTREAALRSPYGSLEGAILSLEHGSPPQDFLQEFSLLSGIKPSCGAKILSDPGGEPTAVLCKAAGLKRKHLRSLWQGLRRPLTENGQADASWSRASLLFETLSTNKAQTVMRYWDWSLNSAVSPKIAAELE
jgi:uncharacterized protein (DUF2336 family)